jgi:hypothetical protein
MNFWWLKWGWFFGWVGGLSYYYYFFSAKTNNALMKVPILKKRKLDKRKKGPKGPVGKFLFIS